MRRPLPTPAQRIIAGLEEASAGMVELRLEREAAQRRADRAREVLVGAEYRTAALTHAARRARMPRHLMAGEEGRAAPRLSEGLRAPVGPDERTALSLAQMRLVPVARPLPTVTEPPGWLARWFRPSPPVLCSRCLLVPCRCVTVAVAPSEPVEA